MSLYVKVDKKPRETIVSFLQRCFQERINENPDWYIDGLFCSTYSDPSCTLLQSKPARRSVEMLYEIVKTYYPSCTKSHFFKQLKKLCTIGVILLRHGVQKTNFLNMFYCPDVQKWVTLLKSVVEVTNNNIHLFNYPGSLLNVNYKGKGEYTYNEIIENLYPQ